MSEWISVEDRLPDVDGSYIVMTIKSWEPGREPFRVMVMEFETREINGKTVKRWKWGDKASMWRVSHWMPLSKSPEVEA